MAKEKEDIFVPLLPSCLTVDTFNVYREKIRNNYESKLEVEIPLNEQSFGISFNTIIVKKDGNSEPPYKLTQDILKNNFTQVIKESIDKLDCEFFEESPLERSIYYRKKSLIIKFQNKNEQHEFYLFINISKLKEKIKNKLCIYTFILTTFNPIDKKFNYDSLSNKEVINLSKKCAEIFNDEDFLEKYKLNQNGTPTIIISGEEKTPGEAEFKGKPSGDSSSIDDIFRSIQFWGKLDSSDARDIINKGIRTKKLDQVYYFYSILTHNYKDGLLRKHFENVVDVMGYCQSVSDAYFDIFYGNVCLEVTILPKMEIFKQTGHDSEEFRIWEILALQSHIVKDKQLKPEDFKILEDFFDFRDFTKKLGKGGFWIDYANYLKEVTGIRHNYNIRKREIELEEREREKALQKLNLLIIVSIFISILTFFLSPIYNESANSTNLSNVMNNSFYKNHILNNSNPELTLFLFMVGAFVLSLFLFVRREFVKHIKNIKNWIFYPIRYFQKKEYIFDLILVLLLAIGIIFLLWMKLKSIP
jgi:hypothetical protein